jgi:ABC-type transport system involved in multi-copper enzyme maturation permease subunit
MFVLIRTIAKNTFIEALRQPIYFILLILALLSLLLTTWSTGFSLGFSDSAEVSGDNKMLLELGLATIFLAGSLLAGCIATSAISREIENKTVLTVVAKPVPRAVVIIGKFVGLAGAISLAMITLQAGLLLCVRHGVLTAVADPYHYPAIVFALSAFVIAIGVSTWSNFFYGWNFCQTCSLLLCPLLVGAYIGSLGFKHDWTPVPLSEGFLPAVTVAGLAVLLGTIVLTSAAVAASTRLNQGLTIAACVLLLLAGMLSTSVIGRWAFDNRAVAIIDSAEVRNVAVLSSLRDVGTQRMDERVYAAAELEALSRSGGEMIISLKNPPTARLEPGASIYYGPSPNGFDLASTNFSPGAGLQLTAIDSTGLQLTVRNVAPGGLPIRRLPQSDDRLFITPTTTRWPVVAAWGLMPNLQFFWLADAVNQNSPVPPSHVLLLVLYAGGLSSLFLGIAVMLFQNRDVG